MRYGGQWKRIRELLDFVSFAITSAGEETKTIRCQASNTRLFLDFPSVRNKISFQDNRAAGFAMREVSFQATRSRHNVRTNFFRLFERKRPTRGRGAFSVFPLLKKQLSTTENSQ